MSESSYYCLQYLVLALTATKIIFNENLHWLDFESLYRDKVAIRLSGEDATPSVLHQIYLKLELTIYLSAAIFMLLETRKDYADFWMTVIHHIVTISLISVGYQTHNFNYSVIVAHMHDISDIFLEFSKTVHYSGHETLPRYTFLMFAVSFVIPRCFIYPVFCVLPFLNGKMDQVLLSLAPGSDVYLFFTKFERVFFPLFLGTLGVLNMIWASVIIKMCIDFFRNKPLFDVREKQSQ